MTVAKLRYSEIWLTTANGKFRVSTRLPKKVVVPDDMRCGVPKGQKERVCVSTWYPTIGQARERAVKLCEYLQRQKAKVIFLFELRLPVLEDLNVEG
jgi:hypothetical protein